MAAADELELPGAFRLASARRPSSGSRAFRDAMASMASAVCLVTAAHGGRRLGRTVTAVFSLSAEPPALLVSIDMISPLADMIARARGFSFAVLAFEQQETADAFAGRGDPERRFEHDRWQSWDSGHPRLSGAVAAMDCELIGAMETGSHVLFAGGVVDVAAEPAREPLIWHGRQYRALASGHAADQPFPSPRNKR